MISFNKAVFGIVLVLIFNFIGVYSGAYMRWNWFDIPMHITGGIAMGMFALALWKEGVAEVTFKHRLAKKLSWWLVPLFVIGFVSFVAIIWEWHEFILDMLWSDQPFRQPSLIDTMLDLAFGLVGSVLSILVFYRKNVW